MACICFSLTSCEYYNPTFGTLLFANSRDSNQQTINRNQQFWFSRMYIYYDRSEYTQSLNGESNLICIGI